MTCNQILNIWYQFKRTFCRTGYIKKILLCELKAFSGSFISSITCLANDVGKKMQLGAQIYSPYLLLVGTAFLVLWQIIFKTGSASRKRGGGGQGLIHFLLLGGSKGVST